MEIGIDSLTFILSSRKLIIELLRESTITELLIQL